MNLQTFRTFLLGVLALILITPKLLLLDYMGTPGVAGYQFGFRDSLTASLQDLVISGAVFCVIVGITRKPTLLRCILASILTTGIWLLLLVDTRVRELYLLPLNWDVVLTYLRDASTLAVGADTFLRHNVGWNMTFRRCLILLLSLQLVLWLLVAACTWYRKKAKHAGTEPAPRFSPARIVIIACIVVLFIAAFVPRRIYHVESNILIAWALSPFRAEPEKLGQLQELGRNSDQKLKSLRDAIGTGPTIFSTAVRPFRNVVIIHGESIRWKGLNLANESPTPTPNLRRLAAEGMLVRAYVAMPGTTKSLFAMLTGWYPYPNVEAREFMREQFPTFIWSLRRQFAARTYCFASQPLYFQNNDAILRACGIEHRLGAMDLQKVAKLKGDHTDEFLGSDELLLDAPARILSEGGATTPFVAYIMPNLAHLPYNYPNKTSPNDHSISSYWKSVAHADETIQQIIEGFRRHGLLEDTLFVIAGDHGESFGEHGLYIHGNSMYEEEITIPIVFWSADGRLRYPVIQAAPQIDLAVTIADLLALKDDSCQVQGRSMIRTGEDPMRPLYITTVFDDVAQALVINREKFIYFVSNGSLLRFDLDRDPDELNPGTVPETHAHQVIDRLRSHNAYTRAQFPVR